MSDSADELTPEQQLAALALASGRGVAQAAADGRTSERTVYRWKNEPTFRARVRELQAAMMGEAAGRSAALSGWAVGRLETLAKSRNAAVALGATKALLDTGARLREQLDLDDQLAELRAKVEELTHEREGHVESGGAAAASGDGASPPDGEPRPGRAAG